MAQSELERENEDLHSYVRFLQIRLFRATASKWQACIICLGIGVSIGATLTYILVR